MTLISLFLAGLVGVTVHWFKMWAREQTTSTLREYFEHERKATLNMLLSLVGAIVGAVSTGVLVDVTQTSLAAAFMIGYVIDNAVNKDKPA